MRQNKNPFASSEKEIGQRQTPLDDNSSVDTSEIDAMILEAGGHLAGDNIIHSKGEKGGKLVGRSHDNGGIKAINNSTGQPLEMEGGEVVITKDAVSDQSKRSFEGKQMTNKEILSAINVSGGGVSFEDGGQLNYDPTPEYEFGGQTMNASVLIDRMVNGGPVATTNDPDEPNSALLSSDWHEALPYRWDGDYYGSLPELIYALQSSSVTNYTANYNAPEVKYPNQYVAALTTEYVVKSSVKQEPFASQKVYTVYIDGKIDKTLQTLAELEEYTIDLIKNRTALKGFNVKVIWGSYVYDFFSFHRPDFVKDEILLKSMNGEDGVALITKAYGEDAQYFSEEDDRIVKTILHKSNLPNSTRMTPIMRKWQSMFAINWAQSAVDWLDGVEEATVAIKVKDKGAIRLLRCTAAKTSLPKANRPLRLYLPTKEEQEFLFVQLIYTLTTGNIQTKPTTLESTIDVEQVLSKENTAAALESPSVKFLLREIEKLEVLETFAIEEGDESLQFHLQVQIKKINAQLEEQMGKILRVETALLPFVAATMRNKKPMAHSQPLPEKLSSELLKKVKRPLFKIWFGNWEKSWKTKNYLNVSKAINAETGEPQILYHGRRLPFSTFQVPEKSANGKVFYFAETYEYARYFSDALLGLGTVKPAEKFIEASDMLAVFVDIKNPIDLTPFGVESVSVAAIAKYIQAMYPTLTPERWLDAAWLKSPETMQTKTKAWMIIRRMKNLTELARDYSPYDGFIYYEDNPDAQIGGQTAVTKAFAVFESSQVKDIDSQFFTRSEVITLGSGGVVSQ